MALSTDYFSNPEWVRDYEYRVWNECLAPFLDYFGIQWKGKKVLDLGCGSGGIISACSEFGGICTGIDRSSDRIAAARKVSSELGRAPQFLIGNILEPLNVNDTYDLIFLNEVIEHLGTIGNVTKVLSVTKKLLADQSSRIFVTFPPYLSPFGGHQAGWKVLTFLPWVHLLPRFVLERVAPKKYNDLIFGELNHVTISSFEESVIESGMVIDQKVHFLVRPEYKVRYRTPVVQSPGFLSAIPVVKEFYTSGCYYLLKKASGT